jgi:hypothetical protein
VLVSRCVWIGPSGMRVDGSWRSLMKTPSKDRIRLAGNQFHEKIDSGIVLSGDMM